MATLTIDDQVYEKLAAAARRSGRSPDEIMSEVLANMFAKGEKDRSGEPLMPAEFYLPTFNLGLRPGVDVTKLDELYDDEDLETL